MFAPHAFAGGQRLMIAARSPGRRISREVFFERSCESRGSFEKSSAVRIVASPTEEWPHGFFDLEAGRPTYLIGKAF
jgi:hypothetical protein